MTRDMQNGWCGEQKTICSPHHSQTRLHDYFHFFDPDTLLRDNTAIKTRVLVSDAFDLSQTLEVFDNHEIK